MVQRRKILLYREGHHTKPRQGIGNWDDPRNSTPALLEKIGRDSASIETTGAIVNSDLRELRGEQKAVRFQPTSSSTLSCPDIPSNPTSIILSEIKPSTPLGLEELDIPPPPLQFSGGVEVVCPYCSLSLGEDLLNNRKPRHWK